MRNVSDGECLVSRVEGWKSRMGRIPNFVLYITVTKESSTPFEMATVLHLGHASPGRWPGEPTYGDTPPSWTEQSAAVQAYSFDGTVHPPLRASTVRCWQHRMRLAVTACHDEALGFYVERVGDDTEPANWDVDEVRAHLTRVVTTPHPDRWLAAVLQLQVDWRNDTDSGRVYDATLTLDRQPDGAVDVSVHRDGWVFGHSVEDGPCMAALDNVVLLILQIGNAMSFD